MGLLNFSQRFIENLNEKSFHLMELLKGNDNKLVWTSDARSQFHKLKDYIHDELWLKLPSDEGVFILYTDASNVGLGGALHQVNNNEEVPIQFASLKLTPTQRKYSVVEKECLAIVWAIKKFYRYLDRKEFIPRTDHKALIWLLEEQEPN